MCVWLCVCIYSIYIFIIYLYIYISMYHTHICISIYIYITHIYIHIDWNILWDMLYYPVWGGIIITIHELPISRLSLGLSADATGLVHMTCMFVGLCLLILFLHAWKIIQPLPYMRMMEMNFNSNNHGNIGWGNHPYLPLVDWDGRESGDWDDRWAWALKDMI